MISLKGKTVLVVDDEKDLCEIITSELLATGANPVEAYSVEQALGKLAQGKIDLVISDIRMPGSSGVELLDKIRQEHVDIPVILITGYADISLPEALARGAEAMVSKPFDLDELFALCARLIKPLTERWHREFKTELITRVEERTLSYGRGGFFIQGPPLPKAGTLFKVVIDSGHKPDKTFEVICRWGRPEKKGLPEGWGAEICAWDEKTAEAGWDHANMIPFIPLK